MPHYEHTWHHNWHSFIAQELINNPYKYQSHDILFVRSNNIKSEIFCNHPIIFNSLSAKIDSEPQCLMSLTNIWVYQKIKHPQRSLSTPTGRCKITSKWIVEICFSSTCVVFCPQILPTTHSPWHCSLVLHQSIFTLSHLFNNSPSFPPICRILFSSKKKQLNPPSFPLQTMFFCFLI